MFCPKVTVNSRLPLHLAPSWFRDCWTGWHQDLNRKALEVEEKVEEKEIDRKSGSNKNEEQETNDEFHSKELSEKRFEKTEEEKER